MKDLDLIQYVARLCWELQQTQSFQETIKGKECLILEAFVDGLEPWEILDDL